MIDCQSGNLLHQFFNHIIRNRTKRRILKRQWLPPYNHIFIGIRKSSAIRWPVFINRTGIVGSQERAGSRFGYIVSFLVQAEVGFNELAFLHLQPFADALDIRGLEAGRIVLAAIGAAKAVDLCNGLLMDLLLML